MRRCAPFGFALLLGVAGSITSRADAQTSEPAALSNVTACTFEAMSRVADEAGLAVHDAPSAEAPVLGRLSAIEDTVLGFVGDRKQFPQFKVIGFRDNWFLIEGASYSELERPLLYAGEGWVEGQFLTAHLYRDTLKAAPSRDATDLAYLRGVDDGVYLRRPYEIPVSRIVACDGSWLKVELSLQSPRTPSGDPVAGNGTLVGWTDRVCGARPSSTCEMRQFDYPWSPLPPGVTECDFRALSRDPDPAGLNLRAAPSLSARVLGRIHPPTDIGEGTMVAEEVEVIGYKKGWFLVEYASDPNAPVPRGFKRYIGRGWVAADLLTTELLRNQLKQAPSQSAVDVVNLVVDDAAGNQSDPQTVKMRHLLACSGNWVKVEIARTKGMKPLIPADAAAGALRGWADGTCTSQLTTCDFDQSIPWSPPAPLPPE